MSLVKSDVIEISGIRHHLHVQPLRRYAVEHNLNIPFHDDIDAGPFGGIVTVWELTEEALYAKAVVTTGLRDLWAPIFRNRPAPVLADWYTGMLRVPFGKHLGPAIVEYGGSIQQHETTFLIENGRRVFDFTISNNAEDTRVYLNAKPKPKLKKGKEAIHQASDGATLIDARWLDTTLFQRYGFEALHKKGRYTLRCFLFTVETEKLDGPVKHCAMLHLPGNGTGFTLHPWMVSDIPIPRLPPGTAVELDIVAGEEVGMMNFAGLRVLKQGDPLDRLGRIRVNDPRAAAA